MGALHCRAKVLIAAQLLAQTVAQRRIEHAAGRLDLRRLAEPELSPVVLVHGVGEEDLEVLLGERGHSDLIYRARERIDPQVKEPVLGCLIRLPDPRWLMPAYSNPALY